MTRMVETTEKQGPRREGAYRANFVISYKFEIADGGPGTGKRFPTQQLVVEKRKYHFPQYSLFYNFNQPSEENTCWDETYVISNANMGTLDPRMRDQSTKLSLSSQDLSPLHVGGNTERGVIDYIRR